MALGVMAQAGGNDELVYVGLGCGEGQATPDQHQAAQQSESNLTAV